MSERSQAIKAVVDAWVVPGPGPELHRQWQDRLQQPSPEGWPALAKAVKHLVEVEKRRRWRFGRR